MFNATRQFAPRFSSTLRSFSTTASRSDNAYVQIIGRIGVEPQVVTTAKGSEFVKYVVASGFGGKANRKTSWYHVRSFDQGPSKDFLLTLQKGNRVLVTGNMNISYYEKDDQKAMSLNINQNTIDILSGRTRSSEGNSEQQSEQSSEQGSSEHGEGANEGEYR